MSETTEPVLGQVYEVPDNLKGINGRPPKVNAVVKAQLLEEYKVYVFEEEDPTMAGFISSSPLCYEHEILDQNLYDWQEFAKLRKIAIQKQEAFLTKQGGAGKYNPTLAIFRLKQPQHGYRDRQEITGAEGKDLIPAQELSPTQAAQLLTLRLERDASDTSTD